MGANDVPTVTPEEMTETIVTVLNGTMGLTLKDMNWGWVDASDLCEFYVRNGSGEVFRFFCERVGEGEWQPSFDSYEVEASK